MKPLLLLLVPLLVQLPAMAQTKFAVKAGANTSTARVYIDGVQQENGYQQGFGAAAYWNVPFDGLLHFSPSIAYNRRGYAYTPAGGTIGNYRNKVHYLDLLPALSVNFPVGKKALVVGAGPQFSVALAGTEQTTTANIATSAPMKFSNTSNYGIYDLGFNGSIGLHGSRMLLEAAYQLGAANINNNVAADKRNIQHRMISLQLGYYFR